MSEPLGLGDRVVMKERELKCCVRRLALLAACISIGECNYEQNTALFVAGVLVAGGCWEIRDQPRTCSENYILTEFQR